ncbi:unnamed protein product [Ilex paraguariensis]|uniref:Uncharacterized protein n=1 Tax=Ilex paraguariensis TaxID=185542 RepID=A0ABC8RAX9_9AQUA
MKPPTALNPPRATNDINKQTPQAHKQQASIDNHHPPTAPKPKPTQLPTAKHLLSTACNGYPQATTTATNDINKQTPLHKPSPCLAHSPAHKPNDNNQPKPHCPQAQQPLPTSPTTIAHKPNDKHPDQPHCPNPNPNPIYHRQAHNPLSLLPTVGSLTTDQSTHWSTIGSQFFLESSSPLICS